MMKCTAYMWGKGIIGLGDQLHLMLHVWGSGGVLPLALSRAMYIQDISPLSLLVPRHTLAFIQPIRF